MARVDRQIVNPRTGQTMIFRRTARDTDGRLLQIECYHKPAGTREPEHIHPRQESRSEVLGGRVGFRIAGKERIAGPGETVTIPANTPHSFWIEGDEVAHYLHEFRPALHSEQFFETLFGLAREGKINEDGMPAPLALAAMIPAFGEEIRPVSPPWPLLRVMAWLLGPLARLRGYGGKQTDDRPPGPHSHHPADRRTIREHLTATRAAYHAILDGLTDDDLERQSGNPAWTVGAVLAHMIGSLELLPREVASARMGKGMYNFPPLLRDWLNATVSRWAARGQTVRTLRQRYDAAYEGALATLDTVRDDEFGLGADFWSEGFRSIADLFFGQTNHLAEHGDDVRLVLPHLGTVTSADH
jgi:quercetin dioxygenase-like cupin family protein